MIFQILFVLLPYNSAIRLISNRNIKLGRKFGIVVDLKILVVVVKYWCRGING